LLELEPLLPELPLPELETNPLVPPRSSTLRTNSTGLMFSSVAAPAVPLAAVTVVATNWLRLIVESSKLFTTLPVDAVLPLPLPVAVKTMVLMMAVRR